MRRENNADAGISSESGYSVFCKCHIAECFILDIMLNGHVKSSRGTLIDDAIVRSQSGSQEIPRIYSGIVYILQSVSISQDSY